MTTKPSDNREPRRPDPNETTEGVPASAARAARAAPAAEPTTTVRARVLVVDDEPSILRMLQIGLQDGPYEVRTAMTGEDGLRLAAEWQPDIVLLDLLISDLDGYEVCRRLRQFTTAPIIVVTALRSEHVVAECVDDGADACIHKPFSVAELTSRVRGALLRRRLPLAGVGSAEINYDRGRLRIDPVRRLAWRDDQVIPLGADLFRMLAFLAANPNRTIPFAEVQARVLGTEDEIEEPRLRAMAGRLERALNADPKRRRFVAISDDEGLQFISH
jgi:DNA-binding response OmpR family regulator